MKVNFYFFIGEVVIKFYFKKIILLQIIFLRKILCIDDRNKLSCSPNQISINPTPEKNGMSLEINILLKNNRYSQQLKDNKQTKNDKEKEKY